MHRKHPISILVYNALYPHPTPQDPPSFSLHLSKNLVGEVRIETANFYGALDTTEARYPGLNYAYRPHRKRLGRFPHHKKLFEAFDKLGLTDSEIQGFCRWEGTLWARERYERDEGVKVQDTTGMEIQPWVDRRKTRLSQKNKCINVKTDIEVEISSVQSQSTASSTSTTAPTAQSSTMTTTTTSGAATLAPLDTEMPDQDPPISDDDSSASDVGESIGFALNERLLQAAAMRLQGHNVPMDAEWEQFLKEAQERGELNIPATQAALRNLGVAPSAPA